MALDIRGNSGLFIIQDLFGPHQQFRAQTIRLPKLCHVPLFPSVSKSTTIPNPQDLTHLRGEDAGLQGVEALGKGWKYLSLSS